jgi:hypothetical protein
MVMVMQAKAPNRKSVVARINFPSEYTVYKALVSLTCCGCSNEINPGDMFTRRGDKAGTMEGIRYSFCLKCRPVIWSGHR